MKKTISILLSIISVICISFTFVCCGEQPKKEEAESNGVLVTVFDACRKGWIEENDLKSIACGYYEWQGIEDNPYSGLYETPTEQLDKETENKIKRALTKSEDIKILKYYGTYEGNVVVTLGYEDFDYDVVQGSDISIGGVDIHGLKHYIHAYHLQYFEKADPSIKITGRLFRIDQAYRSGWIGENDLKSIACSVNDSDSSMENPYSGMYEPPAQKLSKDTKNELKQAYNNQIENSTSDKLDGIIIRKYYGTYNGHMVVSIIDNGITCGAITDGTEIGGVTFNNSKWNSIYIYYKFK